MTRILAALLPLAIAACATPQASAPAPETVTVGIVAINDFHGNLEPPKMAVPVPDGSGGTTYVPAGGAAWLASAIDMVAARHRYSTVVSAGDLISASPLASSLFLDEPTVGAMNRIGLEFNAVGNHEFDRGREELLRMQAGGCEAHTQRRPCAVEEFAGADFAFLSASTYTGDGSTLFPATGTKTFETPAGQIKLGFIGLTLESTPLLVSPGGIAGLTFGDEAEAINRAVPVLESEGADAIVVLIHQGAEQGENPDPNDCEGLSGALLEILGRLDPGVDVVVSGHTHQAYVCDYGTIDPARPLLLTSAGSYGRLVTDIALTIDPAADQVVAARAENVIVQSPGYATSRGETPATDAFARFEPRADIAAYVARYVDAAAEYAKRPVGRIGGGALRMWGEGPNTGGRLGLLIADAQLAATRDAGAQVAFMNTGGIRADLEPTADGRLAFGQIYAVQPFGNTLVTRTFSGAQLETLLEQGLAMADPKFLVPSQGFAYRYDLSRPAGERLVSMTLDGKPVDPQATYRVTMNSFLAQGGDGYAVFTDGTDAVTGGLDLEALEAWLDGEAPRPVPSAPRITAN